MYILGYIGIMEKKMETTIIQYIIGYILGGPYSVRAMLCPKGSLSLVEQRRGLIRLDWRFGGMPYTNHAKLVGQSFW